MKHVLFVVAACSAAAPPPAAPTVAPVRPEPRVDMACVERARDGKLLDDLPADAGAFHVTPARDGAHLHRAGRELTDVEADLFWNRVSAEVFAAGGLAMGNSGHSSIFVCDDAPKNNCFKFQVWICQVDLATLAARLTTAAEHAGLADAMITADLVFEEARGPSCRGGASCIPAAHYSAKGTYDPQKPRHAEHERGGVCRDDGDCEGKDSNNCLAWYLRGGMENADSIERARPTFCGCVDQHCRWFTQ